MLETEMKKLTAALEANTAALTAGNGAAPVVLPDTIAPHVTPGPAAVEPPATYVAPVAVVPPAAAAAPSAITKDQVLRELQAVIQKMGDNGVAMTAMLTTTYQVDRISLLDPSQYGNVIASARQLAAQVPGAVV